MTRTLSVPLLCLGVVLGLSASSQAQIVTNGSFELPVVNGPFQRLSGAALTGFTITMGNVDLASNSLFQPLPGNGNQSLDLDGDVRGAIAQVLSTVAGVTYDFSFVFSDNFQMAGVKTATVSLVDVVSSGSLLNANISHGTAVSTTNMNWTSFAGQFTATGATTRLAFTSTTTNALQGFGVVIDGVSVVNAAIPEPSPALLGGLMASVAGVVGLVRRRRSA